MDVGLNRSCSGVIRGCRCCVVTERDGSRVVVGDNERDCCVRRRRWLVVGIGKRGEELGCCGCCTKRKGRGWSRDLGERRGRDGRGTSKGSRMRD